MNKKSLIVLGLVLTLSSVLVVGREHEEATGAADAKIVAVAELQWADGPSSLPAGAQIVVLDGDPRKAGPFTIRLKMPVGYRIPPHTHPAAERITVISGAVHVGTGEKFDENAGREVTAGAFAMIPPGVPHFAWSRGGAVLQIHSEGPFERKFIDPAHDPPNR